LSRYPGVIGSYINYTKFSSNEQLPPASYLKAQAVQCFFYLTLYFVLLIFQFRVYLYNSRNKSGIPYRSVGSLIPLWPLFKEIQIKNY